MSRRAFFGLAVSALLLSSVGSGPPSADRIDAALVADAGKDTKKETTKDRKKDGRSVAWEKWKFNWSIHPRNGLVLENVTFHGRSVLKYAGLAEVYMTYNSGEPRMEDFGDGIADQMVELFPGKDCVPAGGTCTAYNQEGKEEGKRYVMIHEEATGLNYLGRMGRDYGKMLVLWSAYDMGGYFYIARWRFRDDGHLMVDMGMTGALFHTSKGDSNAWGTKVGTDNTYAPSHVHNLLWCLDFDIDGADGNTVEEFNYEHDKPGSLSGKHRWTAFKKEMSRPISSSNFRFWRVVNHASKNAVGQPRSWEICPGGNGVYRGGTEERLTHAEIWVAKHRAEEHPADKRPLSATLPRYLNDEPVEKTNVVVYYGLHAHHIPRTEDYPAMPVEWVGFTLRPRDFLDSSPIRPK